jgi:hypothetical protein
VIASHVRHAGSFAHGRCKVGEPGLSARARCVVIGHGARAVPRRSLGLRAQCGASTCRLQREQSSDEALHVGAVCAGGSHRQHAPPRRLIHAHVVRHDSTQQIALHGFDLERSSRLHPKLAPRQIVDDRAEFLEFGRRARAFGKDHRRKRIHVKRVLGRRRAPDLTQCDQLLPVLPTANFRHGLPPEQRERERLRLGRQRRPRRPLRRTRALVSGTRAPRLAPTCAIPRLRTGRQGRAVCYPTRSFAALELLAYYVARRRGRERRAQHLRDRFHDFLAGERTFRLHQQAREHESLHGLPIDHRYGRFHSAFSRRRRLRLRLTNSRIVRTTSRGRSTTSSAR